MLKRINQTAFVLFLIFLVGLLLRLAFAPGHNLSSDPFEVITSAKTLAETGKYLVPQVGYPDLAVHYNFAGWPVGFPLLLAALFKVFGYSEMLARIFTVVLASLVVVFAGAIAHLLFRNRFITWLSASLVALNPLLVAFSGRIHTENGELFFLFASITFLLLSAMKNDSKGFVEPEVILGDKKRLSAFLLAVFLAGFMLTVRETAVIYILAFIYILYRSGFFVSKQGGYLILLAIIPFIIGYIPSLYYNYINFGSFLASTHINWAGEIPLDMGYFLFGNSTSLGLPGALAIFGGFLIYAFPIVLLVFIRQLNGNAKSLLLLFLLMLLPAVLVYGAFPNPSAAPRYLLPLVPLASVLAAYALINFRKMKKFSYSVIILVVSLEQLFLFFPVPQSFGISPSIAAFAVYSPVYNKYSYENFPDHVEAVVDWVKDNTESNAVIVTPSRVYHFYYYARRDVIALYYLADAVPLVQLSASRPVYLVEDNEAASNPEKVNAFLESLRSSFNLNYRLVGRVPLFSPYVGNTSIEIFLIGKE